VNRTRELLLHLMVLSVFVESVGVGPATIGRMLSVVAAFAVCLTLLVRPGDWWLPRAGVAVPAALLVLWSMLGLLWSADTAAWFDAMAQLGLALCYFIGYVVLLASRTEVRRLLLGYLFGATAAGLFSVAQAVLVADRAVGLQGDPNLFALYQVAAIPVAVVLSGRAVGPRRFGLLLCGAIALAGVVAAQSRGGLIAATLVLLALLWRGDLGGAWAEHRRQFAALGSILVGGLVALLVAVVPRFDPTEATESGGTGRLDIWLSGWKAWETTPWLGMGPGQFEAASPQLLSTTPGVNLDPYSVLVFEGIEIHNAYLEMLVELGPVGLLLYLGLLGGIALAFLRVERTPGAGVLAALLPMLLVFVTATLFLSVLNNKLLWMLAGFAAVLHRLPERSAGLLATSPPPMEVPHDDDDARPTGTGRPAERRSGASLVAGAAGGAARGGAGGRGEPGAPRPLRRHDDAGRPPS
jgi:O-antigen ligase